jgi:hypothetical protein
LWLKFFTCSSTVKMARTRSRGRFTSGPIRGGAMNVIKYSRASSVRKPIVVSNPVIPSGPSPAFAAAFVPTKQDRRTLFRMEQETKMVQCMNAEQNRLEVLSARPMYGPRAFLKERLQIRAQFYPTFRPYLMRHYDVLNSIPYTPNARTELNAYMEKVKKELDAWTFTPDRVEEGGLVE